MKETHSQNLHQVKKLKSLKLRPKSSGKANSMKETDSQELEQRYTQLLESKSLPDNANFIERPHSHDLQQRYTQIEEVNSQWQSFPDRVNSMEVAHLHQRHAQMEQINPRSKSFTDNRNITTLSDVNMLIKRNVAPRVESISDGSPILRVCDDLRLEVIAQPTLPPIQRRWKNITTLSDVNMSIERNVATRVESIDIDGNPILRRDFNKLRVCDDLRPEAIAQPTLPPIQRQWKSFPNITNITTLSDVNMSIERNVAPRVESIDIDGSPILRRDLNKLRVCDDLRPEAIAQPTLSPIQRQFPNNTNITTLSDVNMSIKRNVAPRVESISDESPILRRDLNKLRVCDDLRLEVIAQPTLPPIQRQWKSFPNIMNITTLSDVNMSIKRNVAPRVESIDIDGSPILRRDLNGVCEDLRPEVIAQPTLPPIQRLGPSHYEEEPQITALQDAFFSKRKYSISLTDESRGNSICLSLTSKERKDTLMSFDSGKRKHSLLGSESGQFFTRKSFVGWNSSNDHQRRTSA